MPKITFIDPDGDAHTVDAAVGASVMETAMRNGVPGIIASCGGSCACATCHVHVDEAWLAKTGKRSPEEEDMLDSAIDVAPDSRLSCQIIVEEELDGLTVRVAARQI
jgi:ferredoxin, 2Fe-2S